MNYQTFKICILIDELVENFYIKHYVDINQPAFNQLKNVVINRNPVVNSATLKIYWIDSENDKILLSCEDDFRLFLEQGQGKKIFFSVSTGQEQTDDNNDETAMDAEDSERPKLLRKSKKINRDEEKQRRSAKRFAEKQKSEEEYQKKCAEKLERKNLERMEKLDRHQRRYEKIRHVLSSLDPANLNAAGTSSSTTDASTSSVPSDPTALIQPSAETIRMLSQAIAGCLQPCNLINNILGEIIKMVPQPTEQQAASAPGSSNTAKQQKKADAPKQQQKTDVSKEQQKTDAPKQNTATNTSDNNTPIGPPSNQEIEALFKEAARELEKMNEIVNANKMEMSSSTMTSSSGMTGITQIERVFNNLTESAMSNATMINMDTSDAEGQDATDASVSIQDPEYFKVSTPPKSMRSRESSIEVHDVNSVMSDDSRDWTILDAALEDDSVMYCTPRVTDVIGDIAPKESIDSESEKFIEAATKFHESLRSVAAETQTPMASLKDAQDKASGPDQTSTKTSIEVQTVSVPKPELVHKSIETVEKPAVQEPKTPTLVLNKIHSTLPIAKPREQVAQKPPQTSQQTPAETSHVRIRQVCPEEIPAASRHPFAPNQQPKATSEVAAALQEAILLQKKEWTEQFEQSRRSRNTEVPQVQVQPNVQTPWIQIPSADTTANAMAARSSNVPSAPPSVTLPIPEMGPAVVVYDPNPKINTAVHTMMNMGFSNESGWLTQLLLNVEGDIPRALNFLTPQPKSQKPQ